MAIATSDKIFIDPSEEIVQIIERILGSEKERIILVIPQNSILLSSYISINILFREISKTKKTLLIVTEDSYGSHIAEKAGFNVAPKVSLILNEMWDESLNSKNELIERLKLRKNENLSNIIAEDQEYVSFQEPASLLQEAQIDDVNTEIENVTENQVDEIYNNDIFNKETDEVNNLKEDTLSKQVNELEILENEKVEEITKEESDTVELMKRYQKPRREPKIINIEGIEMLSGGDLGRFKEEASRGKIDTFKDMEDKSEQEEQLKEEDTDYSRQIRRPSKVYSVKSSFTGLDLRKPQSSQGFLGNIFSKRNSIKRSFDSELSIQTNKPLSTNRILLILGVILTLIIAGGYFFFFRLSSVDITLTLLKQDVSTQASITIDPTASIIDKSASTIPGKIIQENSITLSRTGETTGKSLRGNKSKGVIDILNSLSNDITLVAGTKFTSTETNLIYVLTKDVIAKKATPQVEGGNVSSATRLEDVSIEANAPGADYNITGSGSNTQFLIDGYTSTQLVGSRYKNITGGTSEEFISVSQENIDKTKEVILPDLQKQANTKLNSLIPSGFTLLKETIKFEEVELKASPAINEESKDGTFSLSVTAKISGFIIKEEDLEEMAKHILVNNQSGTSTINNISDLQITKSEEIESKTVITISSKGSLSKTLDITEMKSALSGLSISDAKSYLGLFEEIDKYRIIFSPNFTPDFLQRIPTDLDRINLKIQ